ncbi:MAG: PAC2 family protein [Thaumarchaeota archaeon]|nr:PAC2 family protein [Nitrososphaerota archaeon]
MENRQEEIAPRNLFEPKVKSPILVCGLPGSGYVGKLAVDHLVASFKGKLFEEFYSGSFPPHANVDGEGVGRPIRGELYHCETGQRNDLLVFTADAQPTTSVGEYQLSEMVLRAAMKRGATTVFSLAAYITGGFSAERRVFGAATSQELLSELTENGVKAMKEGGISGMNGIIIGTSALLGLDGACLLGETSGYLVDPVASQAVLEALSRILKLEIDLTALRERASEAKELIGQIQGMTDQGGDPSGAVRSGQPGYIG